MLHTFMVLRLHQKHHKYFVRILEFRDVLSGMFYPDVLKSQTTNPILLYTMTISSIPNPNFRFSQSTFYPEIAPDCEFWSRKKLFRRELSILSQNVKQSNFNFFVATERRLSEKLRYDIILGRVY